MSVTEFREWISNEHGQRAGFNEAATNSGACGQARHGWSPSPHSQNTECHVTTSNPYKTAVVSVTAISSHRCNGQKDWQNKCWRTDVRACSVRRICVQKTFVRGSGEETSSHFARPFFYDKSGGWLLGEFKLCDPVPNETHASASIIKTYKQFFRPTFMTMRILNWNFMLPRSSWWEWKSISSTVWCSFLSGELQLNHSNVTKRRVRLSHLISYLLFLF